MQVLVVEDDTAIAVPLLRGLAKAGFEPTLVTTGEQALEADVPDVVLLDLGLPDMDGLDVCRLLRAASDVPILITTARGEEMDKVLCLEIGADDYLVKPFGVRELVARMRAVLRRATADPSARESTTDDDGPRRFGALTVDERSRRVLVGDEEVALTPKEFDLFALLTSDPGAVFRREAIIDQVWDHAWYGTTRTIDVHIASLRRKLGHPEWIHTVRGVGFRFDAPQ